MSYGRYYLNAVSVREELGIILGGLHLHPPGWPLRASYRLAHNGVELIQDVGEQAVIREARELRAAGLSLRAIAAELAKRGFVTRNGKSFDATQIKRLVA